MDNSRIIQSRRSLTRAARQAAAALHNDEHSSINSSTSPVLHQFPNQPVPQDANRSRLLGASSSAQPLIQRVYEKNWKEVDQVNVFSRIWGAQFEDQVDRRKRQVCEYVNEENKLRKLEAENHGSAAIVIFPFGHSLVTRKRTQSPQPTDAKRARIDPVSTTRTSTRARKPVIKCSPTKGKDSSS